MGVNKGMRPQDVLILAKLLVHGQRPARMTDMAYELGMSQSEISMALERCKRSGLIDHEKRKLMPTALREFLLFGLKYVFPGELGSVVRGVPTAHSAPPLAKKIISAGKDTEQYVWPHDEGKVRGIAVEPLYPSVPKAALRDPKLYEVLALIDAIRLGRAREQKIAIQELDKKLDALA